MESAKNKKIKHNNISNKNYETKPERVYIYIYKYGENEIRDK